MRPAFGMYWKMDPITKSVIPATVEEASELLKDKKETTIGCTKVNSLLVSTIFLPITAFYDEKGNPLGSFETMVFGLEDGEEAVGPSGKVFQHRYNTYEEAMKGHERVVKLASSNPLPVFERLKLTMQKWIPL